jgi:sRNA-binding protein
MTEKGARPILKLKRPKSSRSPAEPKDVLMDTLRQTSPQLWDPTQPVPLAVGVHKQIIPLVESKGVSRTAVRKFLKAWTSTEAYQAAMSQPDAVRVNLDGSRSSRVSEKHRRRAERRVDDRRPDDAANGGAQPAAVEPTAANAPQPPQVTPAGRTAAEDLEQAGQR